MKRRAKTGALTTPVTAAKLVKHERLPSGVGGAAPRVGGANPRVGGAHPHVGGAHPLVGGALLARYHLILLILAITKELDFLSRLKDRVRVSSTLERKEHGLISIHGRNNYEDTKP
jgi:hypothetical protein